jgi:hypothetical protein
MAIGSLVRMLATAADVSAIGYFDVRTAPNAPFIVAISHCFATVASS